MITREQIYAGTTIDSDQPDYVIFDIGGVLINLDSRSVIKSAFPNRDDIDFLLSQTYRSQAWLAFDKGELDDAALIAPISQNSGLDQDSLRNLLELTKESWRLNDEAYSMLVELHQAGLKLFAMTNMPASIQARLQIRFPELWNKFIDVCVSSTVRRSKPDQAIYLSLLEKHNLDPTNGIFIDDRLENLTVPKTLKMKTIHFQNVNDCRVVLNSLIPGKLPDQPLTQFNAFKESSLSISFALRPELFPVVKRVSDVIKEMLNDPLKCAEIEKKFTDASLKAFKEELYVLADYANCRFRGPLGALSPAKPIENITLQEAFADILTALNDPNSTLIDIMPIHSVFGFRVLSVLDNENYTKSTEFYSPFKDKVAKCKKAVTRKAEDKDIPVTTQLGVVSDLRLTTKLNEDKDTLRLLSKLRVPEHRNSLSRFRINAASGEFNSFVKHNKPLAAGLSSHTISLFAATKHYQALGLLELNVEQRHEYALAYCAYLTTAGYHTFHEVMAPAMDMLDIPHDMSNYENNIPKSSKDLVDFTKRRLEELAELFERPQLAKQKSNVMLPFDSLWQAEQPEPLSSSVPIPASQRASHC